MLLFSCYQQKTVNPPLDTAIPLQNPLCVQQTIEVFVHRESGELPLDDPGKPNQRTHIEELDGTEALLPLQNLEAGVPKFADSAIQILLREG